MKKVIWIVALVLASVTSFAQGIAQDWFGVLTIPGKSLHLVFHITKTGETYTTIMDSPDQGANGLQTGKTTVNGNQLIIDAAKFSIQYTGTYLPDSNLIMGTFRQGGGELPLILTATKGAERISAPVVRPQDPKDFPYKQEEVVFTNSKRGNQLAGTITMPADGKARKIVVLITGSGAQNRNEEIMNHRPFLVWSDWLTRHGVAVLRYDDRGTGQSNGKFLGATTADFADDAEAAVNYIRSRPDLKSLDIGLMGHSEGGIIAPVVASQNPAVKFIVLLAGTGVSGVKLGVKQSEDLMRAGGTPEEVIRLSAASKQKLFTLVAQNPDLSPADLKQQVDTLYSRELRAYPSAYLEGKSISDIVSSVETRVLDPWFRYFLAFDPAVYLEKVKCPVLALNGTKDMQVNAESNLAAIKSSLEKGGNKHVEIVPLEGLNHLFQKANTGSISEYTQIQETINPAALEKVSTWIDQL